MADKKITVYPPGGGEPVVALPEYLEYYLGKGWTEEANKKQEKPKADGKTDRKIK